MKGTNMRKLRAALAGTLILGGALAAQALAAPAEASSCPAYRLCLWYNEDRGDPQWRWPSNEDDLDYRNNPSIGGHALNNNTASAENTSTLYRAVLHNNVNCYTGAGPSYTLGIGVYKRDLGSVGMQNLISSHCWYRR